MDLIDTNWLAQLAIALKVLIAGALGGLIGLERELAERPAGVRTHAVLAAAAALFVGLTDMLVGHFSEQLPNSLIRSDPIRVVQAIVTGVGFIGAGTILHHRREGTVEGLTTAASMLLVVGIGVAVAMRALLLAAVVTLMTLLLLHVVGKFVEKHTGSSRQRGAQPRD